MKKKLIIYIFLLLSQILYCQSCPKIFIESQYKLENSHKFSVDLSQEFTLIGMNREALVEEDKLYEDGDFGLGDPKCLISGNSDLKVIPAIPYIYQMLKKNDIVILNECHNYPQNRVLFYTILDSLKYFGFNSLFLETLAYIPNDSIYQQNNGIDDWGYYTMENTFYQVNYKLKELKYNLFSYEVDYPRKIDTLRRDNTLFFINKSDPNWINIKTDSLLLTNFFSINDNIAREAEQALNIYQKIIRNRFNKVFIYCGYTHAFKANNFMAGMLKHLLNKDIYSIDQMYLRDHSQPKYENSLYTKYASVPYPFTLIDDKNNPIHTIRHIGRNFVTDTMFNMEVGAPRSIYINNRPTWLELNGDRKRYNLNKFMKIADLKDFLVIIYELDKTGLVKTSVNRNEPIPVDIFQVSEKGNNYDAILRPNMEYQFRVVKNGKILIDKKINTNE